VNLLLDTHVFLWFESRSPRLSEGLRDLISGTDRPVMVSAVSAWEIAIKKRIGKLTFDGSVRAALAKSGFTEVLVNADDAELAGGLDWDHKDPFDRMLIAQCLNRTLGIVTADKVLSRRRDVAVVWAG
jgi:PIN domain nuclease of toxin-antitoxin system